MECLLSEQRSPAKKETPLRQYNFGTQLPFPLILYKIIQSLEIRYCRVPLYRHSDKPIRLYNASAIYVAVE